MTHYISICVILILAIFVLVYFNQNYEPNRKIRWADNLNGIHYTYSKDEYDRKYLRQNDFIPNSYI